MLNRYRSDLPAIKQEVDAKLAKIKAQINAFGDIKALDDVALRVIFCLTPCLAVC